MRHLLEMRLNLAQQSRRFHQLNHLQTRLEPVKAGKRACRLRHDIEISGGKINPPFLREHVDSRQPAPLAYLEIVEIMGRCDLDRTCAFFRIRVLIANQRNEPANQWQHRIATDQVLQLVIFRMNRNAGIAQHGFGPGGGDCDMSRRIVGIERCSIKRIVKIVEMTARLAGENFAQGRRVERFRVPFLVHLAAMPGEAALDLALLDLEIRDGGEQFRVPINKSFCFIQ